MDELGLPELYEVAARAGISQRYASVYLHDFRGSMQALFSAVELLGRAAKSGGDQERIDRAYQLARRALNNHEKYTLTTLQNLLLIPLDAVPVELGALATEAVHILRTEAAKKDVALSIVAAGEVQVLAERSNLQSLLVGLLTIALDQARPGTQLPVRIDRSGKDAVVSIGSGAGFAHIPGAEDLLRRPNGQLTLHDATLLFALQFLAATGGRLEIDAGAAPPGPLRLIYPATD